jgi:hypothetical protein
MDNIPGSGMLGFGFNILGDYNVNSQTQMILNPPSGTSTTYTFNGTEYNVPQNVSVSPGSGDDTTNGQAFVAQTQQEFQSYFAAQAGVSGSYQGFKGAFNAAFGQESESQSMYWYGVVQGSYEALVVMLQNYGSEQLSTNFTQDADVQALLNLQPPAFTPETQQLFYAVFQKWGTHLLTKINLGGNISYFSAVSTSYSSEQSAISANLSLEYNAVFVDAAAQAQLDWTKLGQNWASDRQVSIEATGGNSSLLTALSPEFDSNFNSTFAQWDQSIMTNPQVISFSLVPLSDVFSSALGQAVAEALTAYLNAGVYVQADFTSPSNQQNPTNLNGLIMVGGSTIAPPAPPPTGAVSTAQLVVIDSTTLQPIANVSGSVTGAQQGQGDAGQQIWADFETAAQALTQSSYIVALSVSAFLMASGYPSSEFATWLQGCGVTLDAWKNVVNQYCGDDFNVSYVLVGQQGLTPGGALEKFSSDLGTNPVSVLAGDFFANVTVPLMQLANGSYTIAAGDKSTLSARSATQGTGRAAGSNR